MGWGGGRTLPQEGERAAQPLRPAPSPPRCPLPPRPTAHSTGPPPPALFPPPPAPPPPSTHPRSPACPPALLRRLVPLRGVGQPRLWQRQPVIAQLLARQVLKRNVSLALARPRLNLRAVTRPARPQSSNDDGGAPHAVQTAAGVPVRRPSHLLQAPPSSTHPPTDPHTTPPPAARRSRPQPSTPPSPSPAPLPPPSPPPGPFGAHPPHPTHPARPPAPYPLACTILSPEKANLLHADAMSSRSRCSAPPGCATL